MNEIRIFLLILAETCRTVGREIDDALLLINPLDVTYVELSLSQLSNLFCFLLVIQIDMIPTVTLAGP